METDHNETTEEVTADAPDVDAADTTDSTNARPWDNPKDAEATIKALRDEAAGYRKKYAALKPFEEEAARLKEESKSEIQRIQERAEAAETDKVSLATENARLRVALDKGVPLDVISSLGGETVEDIESRLEALLAWKDADKASKPTKPVSQLRSAASGDEDSEPNLDDPAAMRRHLENKS